ncbi:ATP-binding protein [Sphaerisporangium sp. NPDC051017]|uniref:ATP-binding protein n=1 Tax=Sphaerisporangium sp. NPDC051017 TaxID=3154636 RepID=UPI0034356ED3
MKTARRNGRHRRGAPITPFVPGDWDPAAKAAAQQLDQLDPSWSIWYGAGTRRFYAAATWTTPEPLTVHARTTEELRDLMREAELATLTAPSHPRPRTDRLVPAPRRPVASPPRQGAQMAETPHGLRTVCWDIPHDPAVLSKVRGMVHEALITWNLTRIAEDVVLAVDELVGNAVTHGAPPIRLSLWAGTGEFCVRVTDHGPGRPRRLDLADDAVHGRGLAIVAALADDYGVTPTPDGTGKTVWARWRFPSQNVTSDAIAAYPHRPEQRTHPSTRGEKTTTFTATHSRACEPSERGAPPRRRTPSA